MNRLRVLIGGSTGYIGIQLVKLLSQHKKYFLLNILCGNTSVGKNISIFDRSLKLKKIT
jgi:Acetylglutamate semialdehyde dehydrogenase